MTNDDEREALADRLLAFAQSASMSDLKNGRTDVLLAAIAVLRRSEVPEPSVLTICECYRDGSEMVTCERHTEPGAEDREVIAQVVKDVSVKWGGPSMAEFAATPPLRKHYAIADALIAQGFHRGDDDERIDAWLMVADHEAFKDCYVEELPLIDSVLNRITALHDLASEPQGEPSIAQVEAAHTAFWMSDDLTGGHDAIRAALRAAGVS